MNENRNENGGNWKQLIFAVLIIAAILIPSAKMIYDYCITEFNTAKTKEEPLEKPDLISIIKNDVKSEEEEEKEVSKSSLEDYKSVMLNSPEILPWEITDKTKSLVKKFNQTKWGKSNEPFYSSDFLNITPGEYYDYTVSYLFINEDLIDDSGYFSYAPLEPDVCLADDVLYLNLSYIDRMWIYDSKIEREYRMAMNENQGNTLIYVDKLKKKFIVLNDPNFYSEGKLSDDYYPTGVEAKELKHPLVQYKEYLYMSEEDIKNLFDFDIESVVYDSSYGTGTKGVNVTVYHRDYYERLNKLNQVNDILYDMIPEYEYNDYYGYDGYYYDGY